MWCGGKESVCQCSNFDLWVRKICWSRNGNPFQYSCPENPMDRRAWHKSQTWLSNWVHIHITRGLRAPILGKPALCLPSLVEWARFSSCVSNRMFLPLSYCSPYCKYLLYSLVCQPSWAESTLRKESLCLIPKSHHLIPIRNKSIFVKQMNEIKLQCCDPKR